MNLIVVKDYAELSRTAARMMADCVAARPDAALVLATGDTPMGAYAELARMKAAGAFNSSHLRVFQLDAYLGLALDDPRSLFGWLKRAFLDPLQIAPNQITTLPDDTTDPEALCSAYDKSVADADGFDLSVLGLGPNGHLGFNEPPSPAHLATRRVHLSDASIESNARYWGGRDKVPHEAITCGMQQLLAARQTLLLVSGARKQRILQQVMAGPITPDVPGSLLRTAQNVTVIADEAALGTP